jgi:hypothetical protein
MVHADLICVPQLMSGEQALAAQAGLCAFSLSCRVTQCAAEIVAWTF